MTPELPRTPPRYVPTLTEVVAAVPASADFVVPERLAEPPTLPHPQPQPAQPKLTQAQLDAIVVELQQALIMQLEETMRQHVSRWVADVAVACRPALRQAVEDVVSSMKPEQPDIGAD